MTPRANVAGDLISLITPRTTRSRGGARQVRACVMRVDWNGFVVYWARDERGGMDIAR
jgi:hypothetical protein